MTPLIVSNLYMKIAQVTSLPLDKVETALRATTFSLDLPNSVNPSPKPDLVSFFPVDMINHLI